MPTNTERRATNLHRLYKVRLYRVGEICSLQAVLASATNQRAAIARARAFVATQYAERVKLEDVELICSTPDDVLDWA